MTIEEAINQLKNVTIYHEGKCTREALDLAIEALEKQNIKPVYWDMQDSGKPEAFCPTCKRWLDWDAGSKYCPYCGQKLSWEVEEE